MRKCAIQPETSSHIPLYRHGQLSEAQRARICRLLSGGLYPDLSTIAKLAETSRAAIEREIKKDPQLETMYNSALMAQIDKVEQAAIDLAINGKNEIAKQKSQEFILKNMRASRYNEKLALAETQANIPRINVSLKLPVITDNTVKSEQKPEVTNVSAPPYGG